MLRSVCWKGFAAAMVICMATLVLLPAEAQVVGADSDISVVTNCNDSGPGSLRLAVANSAPGATIQFALSPICPTIVLASPIVIPTSLTIDGPGANVLAVSGNHQNQVFDAGATYASGDYSSAAITISGLTIESGRGSWGGGIYSVALLTLSADSLIDSNGNAGGAIYSDNTLNVDDSTIAYNEGGEGAGIYSSNVVDVVNSTIANNGPWDPADQGGGVYAFGGAIYIFDSTLSDNSGPGGDIGWESYTDPFVGVEASIVANASPDCTSHVLDDLGYNLDDDGSCGFGDTSLSDTPAGLDPSGLQDNGGPTETILPELGGPVISEVPTGTTYSGIQVCSRTDQRGVSSFGNCTAGSIEGGFLITTTSLPEATPNVTYAPASLTTQESVAGATLKWKKISLPRGLKLSSAGVLSGTPNKKLAAGPTSITVQATETVTTLNGKKKVKTSKTVQATIPLDLT